jgi:hypothetical protein
VAETAAKRLPCCGFRRTGKAMGQVYHSLLVDDTSRNKCFFQVRISHVLRFISICVLFSDSSSYSVLSPLSSLDVRRVKFYPCDWLSFISLRYMEVQLHVFPISALHGGGKEPGTH